MSYNNYNKFVAFNGDVLITDPCYIIREDHKTNWNTRPKIKDYFTKCSLIGEEPNITYGYPLPKMYDDAIATLKKKPDISLIFKDNTPKDLANKITLENENWWSGDKTENILIRKVYFSPTYELEKSRYDKAIKKWESEQIEDWDICNCGSSMEKLGFENFIVCDTLYGDWACTVINSLTKEKLGAFCADSGQVGIFLMSEVLKYNSDLNLPKHCATIIKSFNGHIRVNKKNNGKYTYDGKEYDDIVAEVEGVSSILNFKSIQTGF